MSNSFPSIGYLEPQEVEAELQVVAHCAIAAESEIGDDSEIAEDVEIYTEALVRAAENRLAVLSFYY